jgi:hypothetical protein
MITSTMISPIQYNIKDIRSGFEEVYKDPQEEYLWQSYLLGYSAELLPKTPNLGIPGQDPHVIVAAHLGRIRCEIDQINKGFLDSCYGEYQVTSPKTNKSSSIHSQKSGDWKNFS